MTNESVAVACKNTAQRLMSNFSKSIGGKHEPLIWGVKANPDTLAELTETLPLAIDKKKIVNVLVLKDQPAIVNDKAPMLSGLSKKTVVFIPNADLWNQDVLLRVSIQAAQSGCKALLGFTDPSRLSMGIYQFLVTQQVADDGHLSGWAINMSLPLRDIK